MVEQAFDDGLSHAILKGRLVLALVSARAERCPNKKCGRLRGCVARFGQVGSNFHTRIGDCPNMSEAEWRAVSRGMMMNEKRLEPWLDARSAAQAAKDPRHAERWERLPPEELQRRWNAPEAVAKRAAAERRRLAFRGLEFWVRLWWEVRDDDLVVPCDLRAAESGLLGLLQESGCRCALARRCDGCGERAEGCEGGEARMASCE